MSKQILTILVIKFLLITCCFSQNNSQNINVYNDINNYQNNKLLKPRSGDTIILLDSFKEIQYFALDSSIITYAEKTTYEYDSLNRIVKIYYAEYDTSSKIYTKNKLKNIYTYLNGKIYKISGQGYFYTIFFYDSLDRISKTEQYDSITNDLYYIDSGKYQVTARTSYYYNDKNLVDSFEETLLGYSYNDSNRIKQGWKSKDTIVNRVLKYLYSYNLNGKINSELIKFFYQGTWLDYREYLFYYDSLNFCIGNLTKDYLSGRLDTTNLNKYFYNSKMNVYCDSVYIWDILLKKFYDFSVQYETYSYDTFFEMKKLIPNPSNYISNNRSACKYSKNIPTVMKSIVFNGLRELLTSKVLFYYTKRETNIDSCFLLNTSIILNSDTSIQVNDTGSYQWLYCDSSFKPIPNAKQVSYKPKKSGHYAVRISNIFCTDTSECLYVKVDSIKVAIQDVQINDIKIYPNPAKDIVTVETKSQSNSQVSVYDILGRKRLMNFANKQIDIKSLENGVYLVKVIDIDGNEIYRDKLIIQQ